MKKLMESANKIEKVLKGNKIKYNFMSSNGVIIINFFNIKKFDKIEDQVIDILRNEDVDFSLFTNEIRIEEKI